MKLYQSFGVASLAFLLLRMPSFALEKNQPEKQNHELPSAVELQEVGRLNRHGVELSEQGKFTEAIAVFERAISRYPNSENLYSNLGITLGNQGKFMEAVTAFQKALAINPSNWETYNNLGIALGAQERYSEAIQAFQSAIALNPQSAVCYHNLSVAYWRQQKGLEDSAAEALAAEALAALEKARDLYMAANQSQEAKQLDQFLVQMRQEVNSANQ